MKEFRPIYALRRQPVPAAGAFPSGAGRDVVAMQARDSMPFFMAGLGAIASMPEEKPVIAGRKMLLCGTGILGGIIAVAILLFFRQPDIAVAAPAPDAGPATVAALAPASVPDQQRVVESFFQATTVEQKIRLVRGGEALRAAMQAHYAVHPDEQADFVFSDAMPHFPGSDFSVVRGSDATGRSLEIVTENTPDGLRIDWRTLSGAGGMEWDAWLSGRPQRPVAMRVKAERGVHYSPAFADAGRFLCLSIRDAADRHTAWAFLDRYTETGRVLEEWIGTETGSFFVGGIFQFPAGQSDPHPCVLLTSLLPNGWMDETLPALQEPRATLDIVSE